MSKVVLIVEDEKVLQDVYKLVLSSKGFDVHTADNGFDGLQKLKVVNPDLVLLDIFMPIMDGKEFMRNIDIANYPDTKIVVFSNLSDVETQKEMLDLGAKKFVLKSTMAPQDLVTLVQDMDKY